MATTRKPWTQREVEALARMLKRGTTMPELVKTFKREGRVIQNFTYYLRSRYKLRLPYLRGSRGAQKPLNIGRVRKILRSKRP